MRNGKAVDHGLPRSVLGECVWNSSACRRTLGRVRANKFGYALIGGRFAGVLEFADVAYGRSAPGAHIRRSSGFPMGSDVLQQGVMTETLWDAESGLTSPNETP